MYASRKRFITIIIILLISICSSFTSVFSQDIQFIVYGKFKVDEGDMKGAHITMYKNGQKIRQFPASSSNKFEFKLDYQAVYLFEFGKQGYVTKKIEVDTHVDPDILDEGFEPYPFHVEIFKQYEGVNTVIYNQPVGKIKYFEEEDNFNYDTDYTKSIMAELQAVEDAMEEKKEEIEELKQQQERLASERRKMQAEYDGLIAEAEQALNENDFRKAEKALEKAAELKPDEQYPKEQLNLIAQKEEQAKEEADRAKANEEAYRNAISAGNEAMKNDDLAKAEENYEEASQLKPNEDYPKQKLQEIADRRKQLADAEAQRKATEAAYAEAMRKGNKALQDNDLPNAKTQFEEALAKRPNDKDAKSKLEETEKKMGEMAAAEAKRKATQAAYDDAIRKADAALAAQDLKTAQAQYQAALDQKPDDAYAKEKLNETNQLVAKAAAEEAERRKTEAAFETALRDANKALADNALNQAKTKYKEALALKPDNKDAKKGLESVNQKIAAAAAEAEQREQQEKEFQDLLTAGNKAVAAEDFETAKQKYTDALKLKPDDNTAKSKLQEAENKIAALANAAADAEKRNNRYAALIADADKRMDDKDYDNARKIYQEASKLKPGEKYPKDKINEIKNILSQLAAENAAKEKLEKDYQNLIKQADASLSSKNYETAKAKYTEASNLKKDEQYPKDKIKEIENILSQLAEQKAKEEAKEKQFNTLLAQAQADFEARKFEESKNKYQQASEIFPDNKDVKKKLAQIENELKAIAAAEAEKQKTNEEYSNLITKADNSFDKKDYNKAKETYQEASSLKPNEKYPKDKIKEIEDILSQLAEQKAKEEAKEKQFNTLLAQAQADFEARKFEESKNKYQQALEIFPDNKDVKNKLNQVDKEIKAIAAAEQEKQAKESEYNQLITAADNNFNDRKYTDAKTNYSDASKIKPDEQYPKDKIKEIDDILAQIAKNEQTQKAYDDAITAADNFLTQKAYNKAKNKYQEAADIKKDEQYPKDKIKEIDDILAQIAKNEQVQKSYDDAITAADNFLTQKAYNKAKNKYQEAADIKKDEQYPKDKIKEIDDILAQIAKNEQVQKSYDDAITAADNFLTQKAYNKAKNKYQEAADIKKDEQYPKDKIKEIDDILAQIAKNEQTQKAYDEAITAADKLLNEKNYKDAKEKYNNALSIKPEENYPKTKIKEIEDILAQMQADKQKLQKLNADYSKAIRFGDNAFKTQDYSNAKTYYNNALKLKPNESYPKEQLEKIDQKLLALNNKPKEKEKPKEEKPKEEKVLKEIDYSNEVEVKKYLSEMAQKYKPGVTIEHYEQKNKKIKRIIVNRNGVANEFKEIKHSWGGVYYFRNGKTISRFAYMAETKPLENEKTYTEYNNQ